jgi:gas vesicle protein
MRKSSTLSIVSAFAIGSLIGAGVALLMAPNSGYDTRKLIKDKTVEIKDRAVARVDDTRSRAKDTLGDLSNKTREMASNLRRRGQDTIESASRA